MMIHLFNLSNVYPLEFSNKFLYYKFNKSLLILRTYVRVGPNWKQLIKLSV